jgi:hypothetical protein
MDQLLKLPGRARRMPDNTFDVSGAAPPPVDDTGGRGTGVRLANLKGVVVDNKAAKLTGKWAPGAGLAHVGTDYAYARGAGNKAVFELVIPSTGRYDVRFATSPHENRATNTAITVRSADGSKSVVVNQRRETDDVPHWVSLGVYRFVAGQPAAVEVDAANADGNVHIDAVQALPVP